jgi:hypothetical protein
MILVQLRMASRLLRDEAMNLLRLLLASSTIALLPTCTEPVAPVAPPLANPAPPGKPGLTATWTPAAGLRFQQLVATSAGEEGAIAYLEYEQPSTSANAQSRVLLQRLDASGVVKGPVVELVGMQSPALDHLTLANDGSKYLACWEQAGQTSCATAPLGKGSATAALTVAGSSPALAHDPAGFALAYGVPGHVALARVTSDGSLAGSPALIAVDTEASVPLHLAANKAGFALLRGWLNQEPASTHLHALDSAFAPVGDPIDLGILFAGRGVLAPTETGFAVALSNPYIGHVLLVEGGSVTHTHEFDGGYKIGLNIALAADGASLGVLSADDDKGIRYRMIDGDAVRSPTDVEEGDLGRFDDGSLAALVIHGDMFVAATAGYTLIVARVRRP